MTCLNYEYIFDSNLQQHWRRKKTPTPSGEKGIKISHHEDNIVLNLKTSRGSCSDIGQSFFAKI
jgi:hypothetical protein